MKKVISKVALVFIITFFVFIVPLTVSASSKENIYSMILIGDGNAVTSDEVMRAFCNGNTMGGYSLDDIKTYAYNETYGVTKEDIDKCINEAFKNATAKDICFFYYGGHGTFKKSTKKGVGISLTKNTYYPYSDLAKKLTSFKGKAYVILDCCYAGEFINEVKKLPTYKRNKIIAMTASGNKTTGLKIFKSGWDIIRADKAYQRFTYMLAKGVGIKGGDSLKADKNKDGKVTLKELYNYVNNIINTSNPQYYGNGNTILYQTTLSLNKTKTTIDMTNSKTLQLKASSSVSKAKITWSSSNKSIATVSSKGKVMAKKNGTVIITAKAKGAVAKCKITVTKTKANNKAAKAKGEYLSYLAKSQNYNSKFAIIDVDGDKIPEMIRVTQYGGISLERYDASYKGWDSFVGSNHRKEIIAGDKIYINKSQNYVVGFMISGKTCQYQISNLKTGNMIKYYWKSDDGSTSRVIYGGTTEKIESKKWQKEINNYLKGTICYSINGTKFYTNSATNRKKYLS